MILGVDVGGTKTLIELFEDGPEPVSKQRIKRPTPDTYEEFKELIKDSVQSFNFENSLQAACFAIPGPISTDGKSVGSLGNKDWGTNIPVVDDFSQLLNCAVLIHNDAKLGALSEAISGASQNYPVSTYITISTGIGIGVTVNGKIEPEMSRDEVGMMPFIKNGKAIVWEDFASARAFNERFGQYISEVNDPKILDDFCKDIALGLSHIALTINSDIVVIGGPVGSEFEKFGPYIRKHLETYLSVKKTLLAAPKLVQAKYPNDCVIRGCFYAAKQLINNA